MDDINVILAELPGLGRVRLCSCNTIHLSIGPVTVGLAPEVFAQVAILMRNAMDQLVVIVAAKEAGHDALQASEPQHRRFIN